MIMAYGNKIGNIIDKEFDIKSAYDEFDLVFKKTESNNYLDYGERVSHITGYGKEYILLDYKPNKNTEITIKFIPRAQMKMLFGERKALGATGVLFYLNSDTNYYAGFDSTNNLNNYNDIKVELNKLLTIKISKDMLEVNGVAQKSTYFNDFENTNPEDILNMAILTINTLTGVDTRISVGDLLEFNITELGTDVIKLIPIRLTKSSWGSYPKDSFVMWDTINNTIPEHVGVFWGETDDVIKTEYTRSTGTQYIDLGIKNNKDLIIRGKVRLMPTLVTEHFLFGAREVYLVDTTSLFFSKSPTGNIFCGMGTNWANHTVDVDISDWVEFYIDKYTNIFNGIEIPNSIPVDFEESDLTLHLHAMMQRAGIERRMLYGDFQWFSVELNGKMLVDLESARTGDIGGYINKLTDEFIQSSTSPFEAGPIKV